MAFNTQVLCAISHLPRVQQPRIANNFHSSIATTELSTLSIVLDSLGHMVGIGLSGSIPHLLPFCFPMWTGNLQRNCGIRVRSGFPGPGTDGAHPLYHSGFSFIWLSLREWQRVSCQSHLEEPTESLVSLKWGNWSLFKLVTLLCPWGTIRMCFINLKAQCVLNKYIPLAHKKLSIQDPVQSIWAQPSPVALA